MQIEDLKAWQWVVVGAVVGLMFSASLAAVGPWFDSNQLDTIDLTAFERVLAGLPAETHDNPFLVAKYHPGQPVVRDVVVHPPFAGDPTPGRTWVTGQVYSVGPHLKDPKNPTAGSFLGEQWRPFKYPAPVPFVVRDAGPELRRRGVVALAPGTYPTVSEYLAAVGKAMAHPAGDGKPLPFAGYRFAWPETRAALWTLPATAGVLVVGIAWPLTLGLMGRAGLTRPPKVKVAKVKPAPRSAASPDTAGVRVVLPPSAVAAKAPPVDSKEYGGEFYPVAKNTH